MLPASLKLICVPLHHTQESLTGVQIIYQGIVFSLTSLEQFELLLNCGHFPSKLLQELI
jgi:hypothetical protein